MKWWGYLHTNGSLQAKQVFEHTIAEDLVDARSSPFVAQVVPPFEAGGREQALQFIENTVGIECKSNS